MATSSIFSDVAALQDQVRGIWRFRRVAIIVAWCVAVVLWTVVFLIPNTYEGSAKIYVDTGTTLSQATKGISLEDNVVQQIERVSAALLGTPQLRKVASDTGLLAGAVTVKQQQAVIDDLRQRINIIADVDPTDTSPHPAPKQFTITYDDGNRARSIQVVDRLLNEFVEDSLNDKSEGSQQAEQFLTQQIAAYGRRLSVSEQQLADFKKNNSGLVPGESGDFFAGLQQEQHALTGLKEDLYVANRKRAALAAELKSGQEFTASGQDSAGGASTPLDTEQQIQQDQQKLDEMLLKYTDKYPDVISLRENIETLKAREKLQASAANHGDAGAAHSLGLSTSPVYMKLQEELNSELVEIASLQQQISDRQKRITALKSQMGSAPQVQAEYAQLIRNYAVTKKQYDELFSRLDSARLGQQAASTGLVKFQVINPPAASYTPVFPNRLLLIPGVFFLALGAGIAAAYLLHMLRPVFVSTRQLTSATGLPVLGAVSMAWAEKHRSETHRSSVRYALLSTGLLVAGAIVFTLTLFPISFGSL
ncbi:MAG TPA: XrtA system polysaccharide chain length determinant [Steroidobacteraceae bacterium]|jgi:polysaccharide chain length determinant protein (PEP-CTERM system associated)|nr:XrtA system polysaccharide chain length determinant [Steroidobacteraceae bacterium]